VPFVVAGFWCVGGVVVVAEQPPVAPCSTQPKMKIAAPSATRAATRAAGMRGRRARIPCASSRRANQSSSPSSPRGGSNGGSPPVRPPGVRSSAIVQQNVTRLVGSSSSVACEMIDTWVAEGDAAAVAAAVVGPEGIRESDLAGEARPDSLFALASLTKPLVAVAVLVAAEEGSIDLDAPVGEHLGPYRAPDRR